MGSVRWQQVRATFEPPNRANATSVTTPPMKTRVPKLTVVEGSGGDAIFQVARRLRPVSSAPGRLPTARDLKPTDAELTGAELLKATRLRLKRSLVTDPTLASPPGPQPVEPPVEPPAETSPAASAVAAVSAAASAVMAAAVAAVSPSTRLDRGDSGDAVLSI